MGDDKEINTEGTDFPTCPYCGHVHLDYTDFNEVSEYDCDECGFPFYSDFETSVSFTTTKLVKGCGMCGGTGEVPHPEDLTMNCSSCGGQGYIRLGKK